MVRELRIEVAEEHYEQLVLQARDWYGWAIVLVGTFAGYLFGAL
jgi:hypothetical protein